MLRSNHGCWSCRIRRKKCDENKPLCTTCTSRNITCHGYGKKPIWLDGGDQEKVIAGDLKKQIADNRRKKKQRRVSRNIISTQSLASNSRSPSDGNEFTPAGVQVGGISEVCSSVNTSVDHTMISFNTSPFLISDRLSSYREAELTMHYMDAVFPLQFRFHVPDARGRGWLLWLLVQSRPLYHASLSLSALHQSICMSVQFRNSYAELASYHAQALKDLRQFLQRIQESGHTGEMSRKIEILSCGVSLISFELFQGGTSDWQLHLNALISILINDNPSSVVVLLREMRQDVDASNESTSWQWTALSFLVTVVLWFDLLSCASTGSAPRLPYRSLLDEDIVDMSTTMGVRNGVMRAIGDIATLSMETTPTHSNNESKYSVQYRRIEKCLRQELETLENEIYMPNPGQENSYFPDHSEKVRNVTRVFATAALVQMTAAFPGYTLEKQTVHDAVEQNLAALSCIRNAQDIRGLIWPICISGSMANAEQQTSYEMTIKSALNGAPRDFGNCVTLLDILRWCWRERAKGKSNEESDWRHAMADIGTCLLV